MNDAHYMQDCSEFEHAERNEDYLMMRDISNRIKERVANGTYSLDYIKMVHTSCGGIDYGKVVVRDPNLRRLTAQLLNMDETELIPSSTYSQ